MIHFEDEMENPLCGNEMKEDDCSTNCLELFLCYNGETEQCKDCQHLLATPYGD